MRKFPLLTLPLQMGAARAAQAQDVPPPPAPPPNQGDQIQTNRDK
jgi:hypothetical protein